MKKTSKTAKSEKGTRKTSGMKAPGTSRRLAQTLLVVDDEDQIGKMAQLFLELNGYRVMVANSGAAALALWAEQFSKIELVITDLVMPSIDGATLTRALRRKRPDIPIILATGADAADFTDELKGLKFQGHLQKPYTRQQVLTAVRQALKSGPKKSH